MRKRILQFIGNEGEEEKKRRIRTIVSIVF